MGCTPHLILKEVCDWWGAQVFKQIDSLTIHSQRWGAHHTHQTNTLDGPTLPSSQGVDAGAV